MKKNLILLTTGVCFLMFTACKIATPPPQITVTTATQHYTLYTQLIDNDYCTIGVCADSAYCVPYTSKKNLGLDSVCVILLPHFQTFYLKEFINTFIVLSDRIGIADAVCTIGEFYKFNRYNCTWPKLIRQIYIDKE